jgi:DNA-directed RNA polymerase specialized sigma24 family protein
MQRNAVVLRHWRSLSTRDTAIELGISEGAVKSHTAR